MWLTQIATLQTTTLIIIVTAKIFSDWEPVQDFTLIASSEQLHLTTLSEGLSTLLLHFSIHYSIPSEHLYISLITILGGRVFLSSPSWKRKHLKGRHCFLIVT